MFISYHLIFILVEHIIEILIKFNPRHLSISYWSKRLFECTVNNFVLHFFILTIQIQILTKTLNHLIWCGKSIRSKMKVWAWLSFTHYILYWFVLHLDVTLLFVGYKTWILFIFRFAFNFIYMNKIAKFVAFNVRFLSALAAFTWWINPSKFRFGFSQQLYILYYLIAFMFLYLFFHLMMYFSQALQITYFIDHPVNLSWFLWVFVQLFAESYMLIFLKLPMGNVLCGVECALFL